MTSGGGRDDFDWPHYESDSEAEVEAEVEAWDEEDVPPPNWQRWQLVLNQRETAEEIFGNPAKRRRLQQLARDALEEEKTFGALKASRKETDNDPLKCVILEISVQ